ncbi:hypothetical protein BS78_05G216400 [Paspalum vaginatum]|nr:hypothetical protein BS78_05G216400 [Paspalum vaginatum]
MDMGTVSAPALGGGTTSTIFGKTAITGWHVLKVDGYSHTKDVGVGKFISSSTFRIGEHNWHLRYFPSGVNDKSIDYISIYLHMEDPVAKEVKARLKFSLLGHAEDAVPLFTYTSEDRRNFTTNDQSWGFCQFIRRAQLETSYVKDDSFQIRCDVTIHNEFRVEDTTVVPPPVPQATDLHRHLVGGDVTFEVGGEQFTAHRVVLAARSAVFMAELLGPMKEKVTARVRVDGMEARVFRAMLQFIYTDSLPEMDGDGDGDDKVFMAQHLLVAADRYDLVRLKLISEDMLRRDMDVDVAATTLVLAEQHGCQGLKEACFRFLKFPGNLKAVMASDGFQHLKDSFPLLLDELIAKIAT